MNSTTRFALSASLALLAGCRVGPKYTKPAVPPPPAFKESSPEAYKDAPPGLWQPAKPEDAQLKGKWWEIFNEPELNTLEEQLDINNQNLALYFQNFMAARAVVREARSQYYPTVTTQPSYSRERTPGTLRNAVATAGSGAGTGGTGTTTVASTSGTTSTVLSLPFDVSWEPDLWGKIRNQVREVPVRHPGLRRRPRKRAPHRAGLPRRVLLPASRPGRPPGSLQPDGCRRPETPRPHPRPSYETGIDSPEESVAQADITLKNAQEAAAGVATNRAIYEHAIATLIGKPASSFSLPIKNLSTPLPPIPVGLPSELLERRPDIAGAERTMAEANALIGVEQAAYYPSLSLSGSGGLESSLISTLFTTPALAWSVGASAAETIFDGGLRRATVDQYKAQYNADVASYKQTILTAFQQVEDYIATLRVNSDQMQREDAAIKSAQHYLDLAKARYETGVDPYLNVLDAQNTLLSDQTTQVTLRVNQMTAAVQLVQALGGGWDTSYLPAAGAINTPAAATQVQNAP